MEPKHAKKFAIGLSSVKTRVTSQDATITRVGV